MLNYFSVFVLCVLSGCSGMDVHYPSELKIIGCVDFVDWNKVDSDIIHHGKYIPSRYNHIWIERDGQCLDNMGSFNCDDERYISKITFSGDNEQYMNIALALRPVK